MDKPERVSVALRKHIHRIAKIESAKADMPVIRWVEQAVIEKRDRTEKGEE